jgi:hypothetical protein
MDEQSKELEAGIRASFLHSAFVVHRFARYYSKCDESDFTNIFGGITAGRIRRQRTVEQSEVLEARTGKGKLLQSAFVVHRFSWLYSKCDESGLDYMPLDSHSI